MCYTYDNLSRVTARTVKKLSDNSVVSTETFNYDAAGNVTSAPDSSFQYDTNNRLISFNGNTVSYDLDGNMLSNGSLACTYDSANRLITAGGHTYTYNAEDVRIRNLCSDEDTTYTYNTNAKLSQLLTKTTNGVVTKYVYGLGLIGEESSNMFRTYHFDFRGSTVAVTDASGTVTDTFAYDTYGKCIARTGTSDIIFGYNGRDGVVTDTNGLCYMRARYYSPDMRRFINADIIAGKISNAVTLNRYAYANGNPVSNVDPFGLSVERGEIPKEDLDIFLGVLRNLIIFSKNHKLAEFKIDVGCLTYYQNISLTLGGTSINVDIDSLLEGQLNMSMTFDISKGSFTQKIGSELYWGYDYSVKIDNYNSVSASVWVNNDATVGAEYNISTSYTDGTTLSTAIGLETNTDGKGDLPFYVPVPDVVPVENKKPASYDHNPIADLILYPVIARGIARERIKSKTKEFVETNPELAFIIFLLELGATFMTGVPAFA